MASHPTAPAGFPESARDGVAAVQDQRTATGGNNLQISAQVDGNPFLLGNVAQLHSSECWSIDNGLRSEFSERPRRCSERWWGLSFSKRAAIWVGGEHSESIVVKINWVAQTGGLVRRRRLDQRAAGLALGP